MGTNWIAIDKMLPFKPEITAIAEQLKKSRADVIVACIRLWAWADDLTVNGELGRLGIDVVDEAVAIPGFGNAVLGVGWLTIREDGCMVLPGWETWNSKSAKARRLTARRNSRLRRSS